MFSLFYCQKTALPINKKPLQLHAKKTPKIKQKNPLEV